MPNASIKEKLPKFTMTPELPTIANLIKVFEL